VPADSIVVCGAPSNGTTQLTGTCVDYTPTSGFVGMDTLCVTSCSNGICDTTIIVINIVPPGGGDNDGDGVTNEMETTDGTDPENPCDYTIASQDIDNVDMNWLNLDCDGDGVTNGNEVADGTNPLDPCSFEENSLTLDRTSTIACNITIPDGFSPNNDGENDRFVINGIERFPNNNILIINRWGSKVFEQDGYLNEWDGTAQFGITIGGEDLPEATYFYILDLGNGEEPRTGYIYLNR